MKAKETLRSTCRHCGKIVTYATMRPIPDEDPNDRFRRTRYWTWWHLDAPIGKETRCDPDKEKGWGPRAEPVDYCTEMPQGQYSPDICNRPVKSDPKGDNPYLCGIHLRQHLNYEKERRQHDQNWALSEYMQTETKKLQDVLKERWGVDSTSHYDAINHKHTGMIVVNPRELVSFLEEIFDG